MLKKLSKYGNSTTLVIDKAILELLNMHEGSIVKLTTNGNSLTITPATSIDDQKVSYESLEALSAAKQSYEGKMAHKHVDMGKIDNELKGKVLKDFQRVFQKHNEVFLRFSAQIFMSQEFQDALKGITEKIDPAKEPEDFYEEFNNLKIKFCPELADLDKEIKAVGEKYNHLM